MGAKENKFLPTAKHELPPELKKPFEKATRLEWITLIYMASVIIVMFLTMQTSQAMKAAWFEDVMSLVPALSFLIAKRFYDQQPNGKYPFGYHRVYTIAYQVGAVALLSIGLFVLYDSASTLVMGERPSIGSMKIFGRQIWIGWVMIAALLYSAIPAVILGMKKLPLAKKLHNKILFTDAHTQQADWQTAAAAILGIIGVGFGWWWADGVAACFISLSIIKDGFNRLKGAILDLIDEIPTDIENKKEHPLVHKVYKALKEEPWVKDARIRMREAGEIFFTEAFVIPKSSDNLIENLEHSADQLKKIDWKIHDVVIIPVKSFDEEGAA